MNKAQIRYHLVRKATLATLHAALYAIEQFDMLLDEFGLAYTVDGVRAGTEAAINSLLLLPDQGIMLDDALVLAELHDGCEMLFYHEECAVQKRHYGAQTAAVLERVHNGYTYQLANKRIRIVCHGLAADKETCLLCKGSIHEYPAIV